MKHSFYLGLLCSLLLFARTPSLLSQGGPILPTGTPGPTMKALDQIRSTGTAINATNTPGNASAEFVISAPGSYYLAGNLSVNKANGIMITAGNVTVDLNGFLISRGFATNGSGVVLNSGIVGSVVQNGNLDGFAYGVQAGSGSGYPSSSTLRCLTVGNCNIVGLDAGAHANVEKCVVHDCKAGITLDSDGKVVGCVVSQCSQDGISANGLIDACSVTSNSGNGISGGGVITHCYASANGAAGINSINATTIVACNVQSNTGFGIVTYNQSTLKDCTADYNNGGGISMESDNLLIGCTANANGVSTGSGIVSGDRNTIKDCTANGNSSSGISVGSNCLVTGCNAAFNTVDGIRSTSNNNRFDSNHTMGNKAIGIHSSSATADYIVRNTSLSNTTANYSPASGTYFGPISTPGNASASPWANF